MRTFLMIAALAFATPALASETLEQKLASTADIVVAPTTNIYTGFCSYGVGDVIQDCQEVRVSDDVEAGRINFTVSTELGILNFTSGGNQDGQLRSGTYAIDSFECCRADESVKHDATGECVVEMSDLITPRNIRCEAHTKWGEIHLELKKPDTLDNLLQVVSE